MVESRPIATFCTHVFLWICIALIIFPVYMAIIASTHATSALLQSPIPVLPGHEFWHNYKTVLLQGIETTGAIPIWGMLLNSFIMAIAIAFGKIAVSMLSAYSIVYFRFPLQRLIFWCIFMTLMLPVEVRILPTFQVAATMNLLNSYTGLTMPLIASATATFLFRQFFMTVPDELTDAARIDGAGAVRFFIDILLPLSKSNIAALFIIMFIYGWNQYLWPLVITTKNEMVTIVMGIKELASIADQIPQWPIIMTVAILAMLPPLLVVVTMQHWFVKGLVDTEK